MFKRYIYSLILVTFFVSCSLFDKESPEEVVARVNENYLYKSDVAAFLEESSLVLDSALQVNNYINNWATEQLLMDGALRNVSKDEQDKFEGLVSNYRKDLYTNFYKDALISMRIDSIVSDEEAARFYEENKQNFNLNEDLIQLRYIQVSEEYADVKNLQNLFLKFTPEDRRTLDSLKLKFRKYFLNDSIWVRRSVVESSINPINSGNADKLLKKTNFLQLRDSLGLYLIAVKATLSRKQTAPLEYVRPTIDQIIQNKRKLERTKQLEKEIKDDAIKNKKFEIYN